MNADKKSVVQLVAIQKCSPSLSLSPSLSTDISHSPFSPVHTHTRIIQKYIYMCVYIICVCVCVYPVGYWAFCLGKATASQDLSG